MPLSTPGPGHLPPLRCHSLPQYLVTCFPAGISFRQFANPTKSESVCHSCLTLCDSPGSSVCGILQARILEWEDLHSRGSSQPRDQTQVPHIAARFFTSEPPGKPALFTLRYSWEIWISKVWGGVHRIQISFQQDFIWHIYIHNYTQQQLRV